MPINIHGERDIEYKSGKVNNKGKSPYAGFTPGEVKAAESLQRVADTIVANSGLPTGGVNKVLTAVMRQHERPRPDASEINYLLNRLYDASVDIADYGEYVKVWQAEQKADEAELVSKLTLYASGAESQNIRLHVFCGGDLLKINGDLYCFDATEGVWSNDEKSFRNLCRKANAIAAEAAAVLNGAKADADEQQTTLPKAKPGGYYSSVDAGAYKIRNDGVFGQYNGRHADFADLDQREHHKAIRTELGYRCLEHNDWLVKCCPGKDPRDFYYTANMPKVKIKQWHDAVTVPELRLMLDRQGEAFINRIAFNIACREKGFNCVLGLSDTGKTAAFAVFKAIGIASKIKVKYFYNKYGEGRFNAAINSFGETFVVYAEEAGDSKEEVSSDAIMELDDASLVDERKFKNGLAEVTRIANLWFIGNAMPKFTVVKDGVKNRMTLYDLQVSPAPLPWSKEEGAAWFKSLYNNKQARDELASHMLRLAATVTREQGMHVSNKDADQYEAALQSMGNDLQTAIADIIEVTREPSDCTTYQAILGALEGWYVANGLDFDSRDTGNCNATKVGRALPKPLGPPVVRKGVRTYLGIKIREGRANLADHRGNESDALAVALQPI